MLVHPSDGPQFRSAMSDEAVVRAIDGGSAQFSQLASAASEGEVLSVHGYQMPATSIASDIALDFSAATSIPDDVKRVMVPSGDKEMRQANDVALHWITQTLTVTEGQRVGVIILRGKPSATQSSDPAEDTRPLLMVLFKGSLSADGNVQITHVVFGDPRSIMK